VARWLNQELQKEKLEIRSNCRKIAEQHKKNKHFLQQAVHGGIAFVQHLHCQICVAHQKQKMASYSGVFQVQRY
jgi:hypothetical protein